MKRSVLVSALVALGAMSPVVGSAVASVPTVKTTVKITSGEGTEFKGKVSSPKKQCRANRTVKLYMEAGSARAAGTVVGTAKTDASGAWEIEGSFIAAVYYARVASVLVHAGGSAFRCSYAWTMPAHF
ncbi:MAG TPA: hypothetical protein VFJ64_05620 [Solirubrobacterales bacterium]|nr:hypothetical protein [Solirubrobacterales bacterium]